MKIKKHDLDKNDIVIGSLIALATVIFLLVELYLI
jgi:hypothetical protein